MILHTLNKPPRTSACVSCLKALSGRSKATDTRDSLLLLEDGVYLADTANEALFKTLDVKVYAIDADVEARGLTTRVQASIEVIGYADFVRLATEHKLTKSWL